ncbi:MAG: SDR family NAD(P)-dependent oxidoreductase [Nitrospira sp.]|nr:SDR family NAD(P)-dependent oxidoreductase [Nitrospira sp.]
MPGIALVTGANRGIGLEVARQLAAKQWRVFLSGRSLDSIERAAVSLSASSVTPVVLDVTDQESIDRAVKAIAQTVDHLDILVNNAGILDDNDDSVLNLPVDRLRRMFETNTIGPLLVTQAFVPLLRKSAAARIINITSGVGRLTDMGSAVPAYGISKTALNGVTGKFAAALKSAGIAVNAVDPGWVRTEMGGSEAPRSVEQGADTIVWLATEAPQSMTGLFIRDRKPIPW